MVRKSFFFISLVGLMMACQSGSPSDEKHKEIAELYLRSLYGGNTEELDEIAAGDVVSTYPIYEEILGEAAIRGKESLKEFSTGFAQRWTDRELTIHESVAEGNDVVMVWSFKAIWTESGEESGWGGITLIRFDESGKVILEAGEESEPGPSGRLNPGEL
ncbi:MAG: nuclear transport factor 2 family protein [Bacteroidales bacterium]